MSTETRQHLDARVLVLGSYPTRWPIHGGQLRLAHIVSAYRRWGCAVRQVNVFPANSVYRHVGAWRRWLTRDSFDIPLSGDSLRAGLATGAPFMEDLASGAAMANDTARIGAIERFVGRVDWVHLEQPWLLPLAQRLRQRGVVGPFRLIYGSQNIEHRLKRAILQQYGVLGAEADLAAIEALESQAARDADLVLAVTPQDAMELKQWARAPVVLAPNGVEPWCASARHRRLWQQRLGDAPFALYVASAHPPNISGFGESFGETLAALSPGQRIVLAGTVAEHVERSDWFRRWEGLNARRVHAVGVLDAADLAALKDLAHSFVLPVTGGGGSNLKTAEALFSGRHVVATPQAMRGFEDCADLRAVTVAAPGADFARAVAESLESPLPPPDAASAARRQRLTWASTLVALPDAIAACGVAP